MLATRTCRSIALRGVIARRSLASAQKDVLPKTPEQLAQEEKDREAAAKLAMQSIKDIGSMFSSSDGSGKDDDTEPIDTRPIFADPHKFDSLSLLHQGQVVAELQKMYDRDWHKMSPEARKLGYYISFGNWGPRKKFDNWNLTDQPPYDLPYPLPSKLSTSEPTGTTKISAIDPPVNLALHPVRIDQFNPKRLDGVTKFFIYLTLAVAVLALYRDKFIGEDGRPIEVVIVDPYEQERREQQEKEDREKEEEAARIKHQHEQSLRRKWYYLWLK